MRVDDEAFLAGGDTCASVSRAAGRSHTKPRHFIGGKPHHANALCGACDRPLLVLWDIDCTDPQFKREGRPVFGKLRAVAALLLLDVLDLARLPALAWAVHADQAGPDRCVSKGLAVPRTIRWSCLVSEPSWRPCPPTSRRFVCVGDQIGDEWLTPQDRKRFAAWDGAPRFVDLHRQQLGGLPHLEQGHEKHLCPNKKCGWAKKFANYASGGMKELASVHNDPRNHLPLIEPAAPDRPTSGCRWCSRICPACLTIRADQRCD